MLTHLPSKVFLQCRNSQYSILTENPVVPRRIIDARIGPLDNTSHKDVLRWRSIFPWSIESVGGNLQYTVGKRMWGGSVLSVIGGEEEGGQDKKGSMPALTNKAKYTLPLLQKLKPKD